MKRSSCIHFIRCKNSLPAIFLILLSFAARAHPMPATELLMDVRSKGIQADLRLPLNELQLALGTSRDVTSHPESLAARDSAWLTAYVLAHLHPASDDGTPWTVTIQAMHVAKAAQDDTGPFQQLCLTFWMQPAPGKSGRDLLLYYDAIIHQVVSHKAFVAIRQDWAGGQVSGSSLTEVGVIGMNPRDNSIAPLAIHLDKGSAWRGFQSMVKLGIAHISGGTDHLLFLLVLLLPAPLMARGGRWAGAGGIRYSALRLIKIATAFTVGHSLTLLAGALGWLHLPQGPVEVMIAVSILVTAIHAIRPVFPGREMYVAAGFGLVHGLAFATVLSELQLDGGRMALSILGFNIGIEAMQLFVIILFMPWLIMLSMGRFYSVVRTGGAIIAAIAAMAWIAARISGKSNNGITTLVQSVAERGRWIVLALACCALLSYFLAKKRARQVA